MPAPAGPAEGNDFNFVKTGILARWKGRSLARNIEALAEGLRMGADYNDAATRYEESRQALALSRERSALLPQKIALEHQQLKAVILEGQLHLEEMLAARQRAAELAEDDHKIERLNRKAVKLQAKARVKEAKRALKEAGKKRPEAAPGDMPAEFRRSWATEQRARVNRAAGHERIAQI
ncbi:MAG: hypothetical protein ACREFQ_11595 [Stellaceae bacterium]